jgi:hypothetical protein
VSWIWILALTVSAVAPLPEAEPDVRTTSLWLFDEPVGLYPSSVLENGSPNDYPLVLGPGGQIVPGRFGHALDPEAQPPVALPEGEVRFGLRQLPVPEGRRVEPMSWMNARFAALMTRGETHLRKEVGFANPTATDLNLGDFDWTVELWYRPTRPARGEGVVFELGSGPRGENDRVTQLLLDPEAAAFTLVNQPAAVRLRVPTDAAALDPASAAWHHLAFVYAAGTGQLRHYVDGREQPLPEAVRLEALPPGEEAYLSLGRDGVWERPLPGRLDELRFSRGRVYRGPFEPPASFAPPRPREALVEGPPLLFGDEIDPEAVVPLGGRKHLFLDDALVEEMDDGLAFTVNPPRPAERVIADIEGPFRKHLTVVEDDDGLIRLYNSVHDDFLAVRVSRDGIHWEVPDLGRAELGDAPNLVIREMVGGLGNPFLDPNAPPESRWRYVTDYQRRGIYLYTSPDGYIWTRQKSALLPFRSGTQSCTFYDEQRQMYVSYHRTGIMHTPAGATQRESVLTETDDLFGPWPYRSLSAEELEALAATEPLRDPQPWYLDNGPLTPGGFGVEYPHRFAPDPDLDPVGTDIYVTKAMKYPWAPDAYVAFPIVYFHYEADGPPTRQTLMDEERGRGSGPIETQLAVSRNGVDWTRHPRPAYVGNGPHAGQPVNSAYIAHGMVRRGREIWQYYFGTGFYHSPYQQDDADRGVYRLVQRLDGFVSVDAPYDREATLTTRPLTFTGQRLVLNVDTDAAGYAQVGFTDVDGRPIEGLSVDDAVYVNGDFVDAEVEWLGSGTDVSSLEGRPVRLVFRLRGAKLYAFQFVEGDAVD